MISMTVAFGPAEHGAWHFLFKHKKSVDDLLSSMKGDTGKVHIVDDFGQSAIIRIDQIHGVFVDDLLNSVEAIIQRSLHNARVQAKVQIRGNGDQELKSLTTLAGGGAMNGTPHMPLRRPASN